MVLDEVPVPGVGKERATAIGELMSTDAPDQKPSATDETPAPGSAQGGTSPSAEALGSAAYEIIRQRLQRQGEILQDRLAQLDERLLRDIGIDRSSAMQEVSKPFWRA